MKKTKVKSRAGEENQTFRVKLSQLIHRLTHNTGDQFHSKKLAPSQQLRSCQGALPSRHCGLIGFTTSRGVSQLAVALNSVLICTQAVCFVMPCDPTVLWPACVLGLNKHNGRFRSPAPIIWCHSKAERSVLSSLFLTFQTFFFDISFY